MFTRCLTPLLAAVVLSTTAVASMPAPSKEQQRFEIKFLTMMIDHHYAAVEMAELCAGRTVHPELLALCTSIRTMQLEEIETMQAWLRDWYGITHEPELSNKMEKHLAMMAAMSGAEFERHFMTMMIEHHASAVRDGLDCLLNAYHPEMINLCAMMVSTQADEIAQMRLWLAQWYNVTSLAGH